MKRYILWDHDGVLVETEPLYFEATRNALAGLGVELPLDGYLADMALGRTAWERARSDFELIHRDRDIVRHMRFVLANGDYPRSKPAPDPYLAALQRFGAAPDEAVVVEDSERGLRAALAAGIDCVVVANDFVRRHDFSGAAARIDALAELPAVLAEL